MRNYTFSSLKWILSIVTCVMIMFNTVSDANAAPAKPGVITVTQSDGSTLKIRVHGDEFFGWTTTVDGYTIASEDGIYYYAEYNNDGTMQLSSQRVSSSRTSTERSFVSKMSMPNMRSVASSVSAMKRAEAGRNTRSTKFPHEGDVKSVVILIDYKDVKFRVGDPNQAFDNQLNQENYSVAGAVGSAKDYFSDNSDGKFNGQFDVYGPYTLSKVRKYYGGSGQGYSDKNAQEMILEAVTLADNDGVDFSQYDLNNDGYIDNIFVYYAGYNQAEGGPAESIWPHKWNVQGGHTFDGKILDVYACTSELRGNKGATIAGIGTFCHEFSHVFGLADHYDTNGETNGYSYGLGEYDIMTMGLYNNEGNTPPLMNALEMEMIGWVEPTVVSRDEAITLEPIQNNISYKIGTEVEGEYFLIENRSKTSSRWDAYIPADGLIITHIDRSAPMTQKWEMNQPNADIGHECVKFVVAGNAPISDKTWEQVPFPYGSNDSWSPTTTPAAVSWSGRNIGYELNSIKKVGENITFNVKEFYDYSVFGKIRNSSGMPLYDAEIILTESTPQGAESGMQFVPRSGDNTHTIKTDANGEFTLYNVPDGSYNITVKAFGYVDYVSNIHVYQGYKLNITVHTEEESKYIPLGYHNGRFEVAIGVDGGVNFRPNILLPATKLKHHLGRAMKEVRVYTLAPFDGVLIVQNMQNSSQSIGIPISVTEDMLGWTTLDISAYGLEVQPMCDYKVQIMVRNVLGSHVIFGVDDDESLEYDGISNNIDLDMGLITTVREMSEGTINGNLMIDLMLTPETSYSAPSILMPSMPTVNLPLNTRWTLMWLTIPVENVNPNCYWTSSDRGIVDVNDNGDILGVSKGTATLTATSILDPNVSMTITVNVIDGMPAKAIGTVMNISNTSDIKPAANVEMRFIPIPNELAPQENAPSQAPSFNSAEIISGEKKLDISKMTMHKAKTNTTTATTNENGEFTVDLESGYRYLAGPNVPDVVGEYVYSMLPTEYTRPYNSNDHENTLTDFGRLEIIENKIYEAELHKYYGDYQTPAFTQSQQLAMYAIKIPKESLVDKIGYELVAGEAIIGELNHSYVEMSITTKGDFGLLTPTSLTSASPAKVGKNLFKFGAPTVIMPDTDYYLTIQMIGSVAVDTDSPLQDGLGNLTWDNQGGFTPIYNMTSGVNGNWIMGAYIKEREIAEVETINLSINQDQKMYVGLPSRVNAEVLPRNAVYKGLVWSSSDESIATVDENGAVTFIKDSENVTITATSEKYPNVSGKISIKAEYVQGVQGFVASALGNSLPAASVTFYPVAAERSEANGMIQVAYTRTRNTTSYSTKTNNYGEYFIEIPEGHYDIEVKLESFETINSVVEVGRGLKEMNLFMNTYNETVAEYHTWSVPSLDLLLGDRGAPIMPFAKWEAEELTHLIGERITKINSLVGGPCTVEYLIYDVTIDEYLYESGKVRVGNELIMASVDIPFDEQVVIEEGKSYYIGYRISDYNEEHTPLIKSYVNSLETIGKADILYSAMSESFISLSESSGDVEGNWVIGFYTQSEDTVNAYEVTEGQTTTSLEWNPQNYTEFKILYKQKVEGAVQEQVLTKHFSTELVLLQPGTEYELIIQGSTNGKDFNDMHKSSFTTLAKVHHFPMILVKDSEYTAETVLQLRAINIESGDVITWYNNDEKLSRDKLILVQGKHKLTCRVQRGDKVYIVNRTIEVK